MIRTVFDIVTVCDSDASVIVPPRSTATLSEMAGTKPTQRDRHLQAIAEKGRMGGRRRRATTSAAGLKLLLDVTSK